MVHTRQRLELVSPHGEMLKRSGAPIQAEEQASRQLLDVKQKQMLLLFFRADFLTIIIIMKAWTSVLVGGCYSLLAESILLSGSLGSGCLKVLRWVVTSSQV